MKPTPEQKIKLIELALQKRQADDQRKLTTSIKGEKGDIPKHRWNGTMLQFENLDGSWGDFVDLKGEKGDSVKGDKGDSIKGDKGDDGKDAELPENFKEDVVSELQSFFTLDVESLQETIDGLKKEIADLPKPIEETGENIVDKINDLPTDDADLKIDASHIKNLPEFVAKVAPGSGVHYLGYLSDVNISGATDNQVLSYDLASGKWIATDPAGGGSGSPGGSDTQVQFNDGGSFGGDDGLIYNKTTNTLSIGGAGTALILSTDTIQSEQDLNLFCEDLTAQTTISGGVAMTINNAENAGAILIGKSTQTGATTLGLSTKSNTINIGSGNTETGLTQTINIGAGTPAGTGKVALTLGNTGTASSVTLVGQGGSLTVGNAGATLVGQFLGGDGSVSLPTYSFSGDPDTGWYRVGSTMRYAKDGIERLRVTSDGKISVNANATGLATSNGVFHGTYDADTNAQDGIVTIDTYSNNGWTTTIGGRRARGTAASPSQLLAGDKLIEFIGKGWDGHGDFCPSNRALMGFYTNENWTSSSNNGTYITLNTTTDGTGANHTSLLIDDEGNVAVNSETTNITTTEFASEWNATQSKHFVVKSGGAARDVGMFIRNGDDTAGYDAWMDVSTRTIYHDSLQDHAGATHTFRLRRLGTAVTPAVFDINGALLGVGSNLRLQGATSGIATIVAPAAAGTPTLTLPTTTGTLALRQDKLSAFAATTSAELAGVISDETGSGALVFATSPTLVTPTLGTFASTAGTVTNTVTNYNGIATVNNGLASVVAEGNATAQTAALGAATIFAVPATKGGMYMVCVNANITRAATTSSILGNVDVTFTSPTDSLAKTLLDGNVNQYNRTAGNTTGDGISISFPVYAKASTNIQLAIGYTSVGATTMEYEYHYKVIYLG
jgi:hypothetical protein